MELVKIVEECIEDCIDNEELVLNYEDYTIDYTKEWLENWIVKEWISEGFYSDEELKTIKETLENYSKDILVTESIPIGVIRYDNGNTETMYNDEEEYHTFHTRLVKNS